MESIVIIDFVRETVSLAVDLMVCRLLRERRGGCGVLRERRRNISEWRRIVRCSVRFDVGIHERHCPVSAASDDRVRTMPGHWAVRCGRQWYASAKSCRRRQRIKSAHCENTIIYKRFTIYTTNVLKSLVNVSLLILSWGIVAFPKDKKIRTYWFITVIKFQISP